MKRFLLILFILLPMQVFAATLKIDCDFETGGSWNYSSHFDLWSDYLADEWTITTSGPRSGTYCAASTDPNPGGILECSGFHFTAPWMTWGSEIFFRFWMKHPTDFMPEATDANRGCNHFRIGTGSAGDWTSGIEYIANGYNGGTFLHFYYDGRSAYGTPALYTYDNTWHEYAIYIKMPTNASTADGVWKAWRDAGGTYTDGTVLYTRTAIAQDLIWSHFYFGNYYKGECSGNWQFWVDDIEVWDGIPDEESPSTPTITNGGFRNGGIR